MDLLRYSKVRPSRNVCFSAFGSWTKEEYDRLFECEMPNIDIIVEYVVDQPLPAPTEASGLRYGYDDFTKSVRPQSSPLTSTSSTRTESRSK